MKKALALLLALLLATALFAACSGDKEAEPTTSPSSATPSAQPGGEEPVSDEPDLSKETVLPLVDEKYNMSAFWSYDTATTYFTDMNDRKVTQYIEQLTNIHMDYQIPAQGTEEETFNLLIASEIWPDILWMNDIPITGGPDKWVDDGIALKLNDLIEQYAPNYKAMREWSDVHKKETVTDTGTMAGMLFVTSYPGEPPWTGLGIRQDWLDKVGLPAPVTIDDWYEVLTAFKEQLGKPGALMIPPTGFFYSSEFISAFGVGKDFYQDNGIVKFGPIEPGYKDYLKTISKWYSENLIYKDFLSAENNTTFWNTAGYGDDYIGASHTMWPFCADGMLSYNMVDEETHPDFWITPVNPPWRDENTPAGLAYYQSPVRDYTFVTTQSKRPDLAVRWLDWRYSWEGAVICEYGIPGESFDWVDGQPVFKDFMLESDSETAADRYSYMYMGDKPGWYLFDKLWSTMENQNVFIAYETWQQAPTFQNMPNGLSMTADESAEYVNVMMDIQTYVEEYTLNVMMGRTDLERTYDEFVARIKEMGIQRAISGQQAALDRYNLR
jgi:putative aldouronate transport system substrate-binding protein